MVRSGRRSLAAASLLCSVVLSSCVVANDSGSTSEPVALPNGGDPPPPARGVQLQRGEPLPPPNPAQLGQITVEAVQGGGTHITSRFDNPELRTLVLNTFGDQTPCFDLFGSCVYESTVPILNASNQVTPGGMSFPAGDIKFYTTGVASTGVDGDDLPLDAHEGAVATSTVPWTEANLILDRSLPIELFARGVRLGYTPTTIQVRPTDSHRALGPTLATITLALDPFVQLVPVQVFAIQTSGHSNYAGIGSIDGNLEVWDQVPAFQRVDFVDDRIGTAAVQYSFGSWFGTTNWNATNVSPTWELAPFQGYRPQGKLNPCVGVGCDASPDNSNYYTPDSIWRDCGLQFRLVKFDVVELTDDDCIGTSLGVYPGCANELTNNSGENIYVLCDKFIDVVKKKKLGGQTPTLPTVIVDYSMAAAGSASPAAVTRYPDGSTGPVSCIGHAAGGTNQFMTLAHEVGHWDGTADCLSVGGSCEMDAIVGATAPPSTAECASMRGWAINQWSAFWAKPCTKLTCPPPPPVFP